MMLLMDILNEIKRPVPPKSYIEIGKGRETILWAWFNNKLEFHDAVDKEGIHFHSEVWGEKVYDTFSGRFDPITKELSIRFPQRRLSMEPSQGGTLPAPPELLPALKKKFGNFKPYLFK